MEVAVKEVLVLLVEVTDLTCQKYPGYPGDPLIYKRPSSHEVKRMRNHWSFGAPSNPPIRKTRICLLLSYIFRTKNGSKSKSVAIFIFCKSLHQKLERLSTIPHIPTQLAMNFVCIAHLFGIIYLDWPWLHWKLSTLWWNNIAIENHHF